MLYEKLLKAFGLDLTCVLYVLEKSVWHKRVYAEFSILTFSVQSGV